MEPDYTAEPEETEKVRQEIMRFRELLNYMRTKVDEGERAYTKLISDYAPEDAAGLKEKDLQWKVAEILVADTTPLSKAVGIMRFYARDLEKGFEELHDIIVAGQETE